MKKVFITLGVLAVLLALAIGGGLYYTLASLDGIVKSAIEQYGSEMTGCRVRVGSVQIVIREGRGTIRGLRIANPAGFSDDEAFRLGEISLGIDLESLRTTPIVIDHVVISDPDVRFEVRADGQNNLQTIQKNLERYSPSSDAAASAGDDAGGSEVLMRIARFEFEKGDVIADTTTIGGKQASVALPSFEMKNVGGRSGATGAEIGQTILTAYTTKVAKIVTSKQLDRLIDQKVGGEKGEAAKKLLDKFMK